MNERPSPPAFLRLLDKVNDALVWACLLIAGVALVAMTAIFAWLVFGRYVLNDTPTWVEQVSLLLVMVIAFLGAAAGVQRNTHLSVALFRGMVPARVRTVIDVASSAKVS